MAVATNKGMSSTDISATVEISGGDEPDGFVTHFVTEIRLPPELDARCRTILMNSSRTCTVHKLLEGRVEFEERVV